MKKRVSRRKRRMFLKKVKCIMVLLGIVVGIFSVKMVNAGINDSVIEKNRVEGVYAVTRLNGEDRIFYLNMYTLNGRSSYCIEIGVDIATDIYNSTYDFSVSKLSNSKIEYIRNISYFGYGYPGHDDYRYYMAAQELIWEYLNDIEVEWTDELNVYGDLIDITKYKNNILKLIKDYKQGFDFRGYEEHKVVNIGDRIDITDVNDTLKYYEIVSGEHMNATIYEQLIYIDFDTDYVGKDSLILKRKDIYDYDSMLYYQGSSQKLISNGNVNEQVELIFDISGKNITFLIVDNSGQSNFKGLVYELLNKDGEVVGKFKDNIDGKFLAENIAYGDYCVKQVGTNNLYKLRSDSYCFTFDNNTGVVFLEVEPLLNNLKIFKLYGDSNNLQKENEALFEIYNLDGSLYGSIKTDSEGIGSIEIPYGEYIVKQLSGKNGYYMVDDFKVDAKVRGKVIEYTLVDKEIMVNLIVNSKNEEQGFVKDNDIYYKVKREGDEKYLEKDGVNEFKNIDGQVIIPCKLSYGNYVLEVINRSNDYEEIVSEIKFEINDSSTFEFIDGQLYLEIDINYELIEGSLKINTYKENFINNDGSFDYEYIKIGEVNLELVANEDIIVNGEIIYEKGNKVLDVITNSDGEYIVDKLYMGSYCVVSAFEDDVCIEIIDNNMVEVVLKEVLNKGSVSIHNVSSKVDNIINSMIELYDEDNNLIFTGITNEEGLIKIDNLVYGDYCISQKKVNDKYILNKDKVCFSVKDNILVELEITNREVGKKFVEIPNTFNEDDNINKLVVFILIILGGIVYKVKVSDNN